MFPTFLGIHHLFGSFVEIIQISTIGVFRIGLTMGPDGFAYINDRIIKVPFSMEILVDLGIEIVFFVHFVIGKDGDIQNLIISV